jgi:phytoene dehydrogenase-like protein
MERLKYDVVVVGSGMGGLCAGALLSHRGYKTLVVEKLSRIGGRCSTEEYEGFQLPTGAMAIHKGGGMGEVFNEVGTDMDLVMIPPLYWRMAGKDYKMPAKGSVTVMLDIINKLEVDRTKLLGGLAKAVASEKIMGAFRKGIAEAEKQTMTFRDWLLQYTDNELAQNVFDSITITIAGGHSYEMPAASVFGWFVKMGGARDVGYPPHGHLFEMEKLAKVIRANGDVWINCPAKRIVAEGGRARGIVVEKDGQELEIASEVVISNVIPKRTVELAGADNFDEGYLRLMRLRHRPQLLTVTFVASDRPLWPESGESAILMLTGTRRITSIVPISNIVSGVTPPGQHLFFAFASPKSLMIRMDVEEEQRQITLDLKEQLPLFEKHGRILRMIPRNLGDEFAPVHAWPGLGMPVETPVKNLYNVGDPMLPVGLVGTTGAVDSARRVAEIIRKRFEPRKA